MFVRLLLIAAIIGVVWYLFRRLSPTTKAQQQAPPPTSANPQAAMDRCLECGVHAPEDSGVRYQQAFFCCPEHMNKHIKKMDAE